MQDSCGNCKNLKYRKDYTYPFQCICNKKIAYTEEAIVDRIMQGYKCAKYVRGFQTENENFEEEE